MALIKVILIHTLLLVSASIVLTEENQEKAGLFGLPDFSSFFPGSGGSGSGFSFSNLFGRQGEALAPESAVSAEGDEHHNRLFFSLLPSLTTCNFTREAGATCRSCRESLTCLSNNVGLLRTCRGFFRYCNNGYCSLFQGSACSSSSNSTSTANRTTTLV